MQMNTYLPVADAATAAEVLGIPEEQLIKLDANENPYGPSPLVREALAQPLPYHLYPDAMQRRARAALAEYTGIPAEQIVLGNGSDELIDLLLLALVKPGDDVLVPVPTFGVYLSRPPLFGAAVQSVARNEDFDLDIPKILSAIRPTTRLIFLASPNNPTGNPVTRHQLEQLLRTGIFVVADEAYYEFAGQTFAPLLQEYDNLGILRTFSKWAGLAGLRIGYGLFPRWLADRLWAIKQPFNVSVPALRAVEAALADRAIQFQTVIQLRLERGRLYRKLRTIPYLKPYPSHGNFILCRVTVGDAHAVHAWLAQHGILVRKYDDPLLRDCLRISVGLPEHTDQIIAVLQSYQPEANG